MNPTMSVAHLRCEYLPTPIAIDTPHPRLSWQLYSTQRGQQQSAYQILVATTKEMVQEDAPDLWNSGKVTSSQSLHIVYAGKELQSNMRCWWKVRVWDQMDNASDYSDASWWEMGLLSSQDWRAHWISLDKPEQELEPPIYFRRSLVLTQPVHRARLYATARGVYELSLNGARVGNALLAPGWTDYNKHIQYQAYDLTNSLQQGENVLGALLGTGWYCGHVGFGGLADNIYGATQQRQHYGRYPEMLLQLHIDYADGSSQLLLSDESWRATTGPILFSDLLMGETYDARKELTGWNLAAFDDTAWSPVRVQDRGPQQLVADPAQPVQITQELTPVVITSLESGQIIFDMGQNMVGWARLQVRGRAGTQVQLRFAEMLNPDGTLYTENLRSAKQTDRYILKGEAIETFEPHFTFHGFRYIEMTVTDGALLSHTLTACVVHSATPHTGTFTCSSSFVNQLQKNIEWSQRSNFLSIPTDCPQRDERLGWLADAQIFCQTACYNRDVAAFFTKWMRDVVVAQSPEGGFPDVAPRMNDLDDGCPGWGDAGIIIPWTIYQMYGDTRIIEEHYTAMQRWIAYIQEANPDLLWRQRMNNNFGDWLSIGADTPKDVLATAYFAYDAHLMSRMAQALGREQDATEYQTLFERIKQAFCYAYVSPDARITGETQTCYVLALAMDLLPPALRAQAARHLVADIEKRGWHLSTGFIGVRPLCPVLTEAGYADVAYRLLFNDTFPSWGYSIRHGATTIWERWDGWTEEHGFQDPSMNSFNHYSLGSVGQWLYEYVAGIKSDPTYPAFQHTIIQPTPGLTEVKAEYASIRGLIRSHWSLSSAAFTLHITLPANTTATVSLPAPSGSTIFEGDLPAHMAQCVTFVRQEADRAIFEVQSGNYNFRVLPHPPAFDRGRQSL